MQLIVYNVEVTEYNGCNTKIAGEAGLKLKPRTYVNVVTIRMHMVTTATENSGQMYTIFTNDQQLFNIIKQMTWWQPKLWENFYPDLGGMHLLMSFVGCIGNLMGNTGLSNILKTAFGGVDKILLGKHFSNNIRSLRMAVEEILRLVLLNSVLPTFDDLMSYLEGLASKNRTAKLSLDGIVWPIFIALRFNKISC